MDIPVFRKIRAYLPAIASGFLAVLSFPSFDLPLLAWAALVPFFLSLWEKESKEAFFTGFVFGLTFFFGSLYWIYHSIHHYGNIPFAASISLVVLLCMYLSLYPACFAFLFAALFRKTKLPAVLTAPVLWVVFEFVRAYALTGFPWASIGYSQHAILPVIQISDITGIYGVSFLVLSCNSALADLLLLKSRLKKMPLFPVSTVVAGAVSFALLLMMSLGYGLWRLSEDRPGRPVNIGIIQGSIEQDQKWNETYQQEVLQTYLTLSGDAARTSPDMMVWPETALPFYYGSDQKNTELLQQYQQQLHTYLLFGSVLVRGHESRRQLLSNSAVLLDPEGKTIYNYDKIHLVPFGEYVPLRNILFFVDKLVAGIGDYIPGKQYVRAYAPFGSFATFICYEIIFPGMVRKFYVSGGDLMVTITNDAWFGRTAGPFQHFSMAVFRAVENRKPVIRAANTGISGMIDSSGRVIAKTGLFERTQLIKTVRTDRSKTFYTKYGDIFSYICIVISILLLLNRKVWR